MFKSMGSFIGRLFTARDNFERRLAEYAMENATLRAKLVAAGLEKEAALEEAAAERLNNAAGDQRIAALLLALDRSRKHNEDLLKKLAEKAAITFPPPFVAAKCEACEARRIEDLNRHGEEKRDLEKFNDAQAARAMSRQTKGHFQAYQKAVGVILDQLDTLGQKNHVTKEDLRKLRDLRKDLSDQLGRTI